MMSSAFLTTCHSKYRQEPFKIKEFFGTSYIFLIHCASLNFIFLWGFVYFMDKPLNSYYNLKEIYFVSYCGNVCICISNLEMNGSDLNSRAGRWDDSHRHGNSTTLFFFALVVLLLPFLCRISKYLCRYVNQSDKNDGKPFFFPPAPEP